MPGISYLADAIPGLLSRFATSNYAFPTPDIRIFDRLLDDMMILLSTPRSQRTMAISGLSPKRCSTLFQCIAHQAFFVLVTTNIVVSKYFIFILQVRKKCRYLPVAAGTGRSERPIGTFTFVGTLAAEWIVPFVCARCFATTAVPWSVSSRLRWLETLLSEVMAVMEDVGSSG